MKSWINKYLNDGDLKEIQNRISEIEKSTSGEIRLSIRQKRAFKDRKLDLHDIAVRDFHSLGMQNTKDKTGVLIFVLFSERYYDILADEGIHKKISDDIWAELEEKIKTEFKTENYKTAILHVIERIGAALIKEFPGDGGDANELPDEVVIN